MNIHLQYVAVDRGNDHESGEVAAKLGQCRLTAREYRSIVIQLRLRGRHRDATALQVHLPDRPAIGHFLDHGQLDLGGVGERSFSDFDRRMRARNF
jgi:hypothetical protein